MRLGYLPQLGEAPYADEDQADAYRRGVVVGHSFGVHDARSQIATPSLAAVAREILGGFFAMLGGTALVLYGMRALDAGAVAQAVAAVVWACFVLWLWLWRD
jgi:hypothetical protein